MRQVLQALSTGSTELVEVPVPQVPRSGLLIQTRRSLISAGTERMLVEFGRSGWIDKARQQPDKVAQVVDKIFADGLLQTLAAVKSKLDQTLALGYCNVGTVLAAGPSVSGFTAGDRIASNGSHAEIVAVPGNLCARVPDGVTDEEAAFTVLGAIALQGIRLAAPTLGECFAVTGLGLIGLITVQLLRANGCRVLGIDPDPHKTAMARQFGAQTVELSRNEDAIAAAEAFSRGRGLDGVLVTAATKSSEPISQAARMCRKRGRIVLVGVTGLELNRAEFYEKELSFQVSCSYGPGRYDPAYEEKGQDYPAGFVRWTQQRNFEAVLDMMAAKSLDVRPLITHRFLFERATAAYDLLASGREPYLGIVLEYPDAPPSQDASVVSLPRAAAVAAVVPEGKAVVGVIGAGNYAGRVLIPALAKTGAHLQTIASGKGVTASYFGRKYGFAQATSSVEQLLSEQGINTVIVATRHDSHARFVCQALAAGKHVFVEKPLALNFEELDAVHAAHAASGRQLCIGFNRRFAPLSLQAKEQVRTRGAPLAITITVNAGELPRDHWAKDAQSGGGRILGEGCHFIDLARFFVGHPIKSLQVTTAASAVYARVEDISLLQLGFEDGSVASIQYLANGHKRFPKERVEIFWENKALRIDNFRKLHTWGTGGASGWGFTRQDKGHKALLAAFIASVSGAAAPIAADELFEVSHWSIKAGRMAFGKDPS